MKRVCTLLAMFAILMAGFMSVCVADENCALEAAHIADHSEAQTSHSSTQQTAQDHCGLLCHVAPHNIPLTMAKLPVFAVLSQGCIMSTDSTISLGLYTVLDQPPRA